MTTPLIKVINLLQSSERKNTLLALEFIQSLTINTTDLLENWYNTLITHLFVEKIQSKHDVKISYRWKITLNIAYLQIIYHHSASDSGDHDWGYWMGYGENINRSVLNHSKTLWQFGKKLYSSDNYQSPYSLDNLQFIEIVKKDLKEILPTLFSYLKSTSNQ